MPCILTPGNLATESLTSTSSAIAVDFLNKIRGGTGAGGIAPAYGGSIEFDQIPSPAAGTYSETDISWPITAEDPGFGTWNVGKTVFTFNRSGHYAISVNGLFGMFPITEGSGTLVQKLAKMGVFVEVNGLKLWAGQTRMFVDAANVAAEGISESLSMFYTAKIAAGSALKAVAVCKAPNVGTTLFGVGVAGGTGVAQAVPALTFMSITPL